MRGISMSSRITSGTWSCSSATASMPSRAVSTRMPLRSSSRWVTRRTVMESSPTIAKVRRSPRSFGATGAWARARHSARTSAPMSRMMTMRPSPRMVAPDMPRMPEICGPTDLTTISRLPTSSSATSPVECSPARTNTTGMVTSCPGSSDGASPTNVAMVLEAILLSAVVECCRLAPQVRTDHCLGQAQHPLHRGQRQRVKLLVGAHHEGVADREREWQAAREHRALARLGLHVQRAAQALDLGGHDVHADAAARLLRDRAGGGEPRLEDQLNRILVAQGLSRADESQGLGLLADRAEIHADAVVGEAHHDLGAFAMQLEENVSGVGLAGPHALLGFFDAVHHRVAQHVLERRQHALEHLPVEFAGGALDGELGALAGLGGRPAAARCA